MLVLSRKKSEKIIVELGGTVIEVVVVEIRGDKVRLGIQAPRDVNVNREEIHKLGLSREESQKAKGNNRESLAKPVDSTIAQFIKERAS